MTTRVACPGCGAVFGRDSHDSQAQCCGIEPEKRYRVDAAGLGAGDRVPEDSAMPDMPCSNVRPSGLPVTSPLAGSLTVGLKVVEGPVRLMTF